MPSDVAVMGHDKWEPIATGARPPLSTIDMRLEMVGRRPAELLFEAISGDAESGLHAVPTELVTRGSTALA